MTNKFNFKISLQFNEESYLSIYRTKNISKKSKYSKKFILRLVIAFLITIVSFLFIYTSIIGFLIIIIYLIIFFESKLLVLSEKIKFFSRKYLREKITYILNNNEIIIRSKSLNIKTSWSLLYSWHIRGNWLILAFTDVPNVYLPINKLKDSLCFEKINKLIHKYGKEYKS